MSGGGDTRDLIPGGGSDLIKYDSGTSTELSVSPDLSTEKNSDTFQSSDLTKPSSESESWRGASDEMQPSDGAGSGNIEKGSKHNDAQWLRAFSLVVYASGASGGSSRTRSSTRSGYSEPHCRSVRSTTRSRSQPTAGSLPRGRCCT